MSACQTAGSRYMSVFVRTKSRLGRPSTRYPATVNGPPQKPISACSGSSSARTIRTASRIGPAHSSGSATPSRPTAAAESTRSSTTGPTPSTSSTSTPRPRTGDMMSAKRTAASTPCRRTGCRVTSAQSSGVPAISKKPCRSRSARYSGRERPACRMNQTGVRSAGSRRSTRTRSGSIVRVLDADRLATLLAEEPREALLEGDLGLPAEQLLRPRDVGFALQRVVDPERLEHDLAGRPGEALHHLGKLEQRPLVGVAEIDRQVLVALGEEDDAADQIVDVAEAPRLRAVAEDGDRLLGKRLADEVRDCAPIVRPH